jgi:hypothetical protein
MRIVALVTLAMLVVTPCDTYRRKNAGTQHSRVEMTGPDWYGDSTTKLVRLDQGWTAAESDWFYWTTQESQVLPYAFLALEQADAPVLFRDAHTMQK